MGAVSSGTEKSEVSILDEGKSGDIKWKVDSNGVLWLTGNGDYVFLNNYKKLPWHDYSESITSAVVDISGITNTSYMFYNCNKLTSLDLSSFDTSSVTNMSGMFFNCDKLINLDLNNFDTCNVTDMSAMFAGCQNLTSLNLSNFNTSNVSNMPNMFYCCNKLTNLDVSNFDTSNVTNMSVMFLGCHDLISLDVSNFDTSNVTDMRDIFEGCDNLTKIHTPINVTKLIELPSSNNEKWYMDTTEVTHLPQNLNYSVTLVKATSTPDESETPAKVLIEDITISPSEISLKVGEKRTLSKSCTPSNADKQSVSWHSTEPDIASVDNQGTVIGVSEGTGQIYCVSQDGGNVESNYCTVEVASDSDISTTEIPKAMKYVPYSFMLQDSIESSQDTSNYRITSGSLPAGMKIKSDGELYGVPEETGKFTFTVAMDNDNAISEKQQKVLQKLLSPVIYQYENKSIAAKDFTEEDIIQFLGCFMNDEQYTREDSNEFMIFENYEREDYKKIFDKKEAFQHMNDIFGKAINENLIAKDSFFSISRDKIKVTGADGAPVVDSKIMAYRKENKNLILSIHYKVEHNVSEFDREGNTTVVLVENEDSFIRYTL